MAKPCTSPTITPVAGDVVSIFLNLVVEALAMWESQRDFQERWKGWETALLFPGFPPFGISKACFRRENLAEDHLHMQRCGFQHKGVSVE